MSENPYQSTPPEVSALLAEVEALRKRVDELESRLQGRHNPGCDEALREAQERAEKAEADCERNHAGLREYASGTRVTVKGIEHHGVGCGSQPWMGQDVALLAMKVQKLQADLDAALDLLSRWVVPHDRAEFERLMLETQQLLAEREARNGK